MYMESINLHACNVSSVAMIATVKTTGITITLAIAIIDSCRYILIHTSWLAIAYMYIHACIYAWWIHVPITS